MSLEDLLTEDSVTIQRPTVVRDAAGGTTRTPFVDVAAGVPARVMDVSAAQALVYAQLSLKVTHKVLTQQAGVANGWGVKTSDGRFLRVTGVQRMRGIGAIDDYYELLAEELRPGA